MARESVFDVRGGGAGWGGRFGVMLAVFLFSLPVHGCTTGIGKKQVEVATLHAGLVCGGTASDPSVRWISDDATYRQVAAAMADRFLGTEKTGLPPVKFSEELALLIAMGQKTTGGYSLTLAEGLATVEDGVVTVRVFRQTPALGAMLTQQLTSPCLIVRLPKALYSKVLIIDQHGLVLSY